MTYELLLEQQYEAQDQWADAHAAQVEELLDNRFSPYQFENIEEAVSDEALKFFQKELMNAVAKADDAEFGRIVMQAVERYWMLRAEAEIDRLEASHV